MKLVVRRSKVSGTVHAPPSKSHTHRAFLLAALSHGVSRVTSPLLGEDTCATLAAVAALGAEVSRDGDTITIRGGNLHAPNFTTPPIDCKNSGTSLRMLTGIASRLAGTTRFTGDASLCSRPMQPLLDAVVQLGAEVSSAGGCAPVSVTGPASGCEASIRGDVSSQFISGLLLSAPLGEGETRIRLTTPLTSRPYVNMTIAAMQRHGVTVTGTDDGFFVPGGQWYRPADSRVGGDFSSAAFLFVAAALTGTVTVTGLDSSDPQGDQAVLSLLKMFGAGVVSGPAGISVCPARLSAADVNLADIPDLFPVIAVRATQAAGTSRLYGAAHLRFKESDRIMSTARFLKAMGADIRETEDGCVITGPTPLTGTTVTTFGDHRIMMAGAVAGLVAAGSTVLDDADCCTVSYPSFVADMRRLGADMEVQ